MADPNNNAPIPPITNPLQNNNMAMTIIAYVAGIMAAKFPIFDLATWNYIFLSVLGLAATVGPLVLNRKSAVISTTAKLPEVKKDGAGVVLDKTAPGSAALAAVTPDNVVAK